MCSIYEQTFNKKLYLTGHACMIGSKTGKIISYAVRNKSCRFCENAALSKEPPKQHDCRKNWDGSAKGKITIIL